MKKIYKTHPAKISTHASQGLDLIDLLNDLRLSKPANQTDLRNWSNQQTLINEIELRLRVLLRRSQQLAEQTENQLLNQMGFTKLNDLKSHDLQDCEEIRFYRDDNQNC